MGRPQARKRHHKSCGPTKRRQRIKKCTKDLDQIHFDLKPVYSNLLNPTEKNEDLPGDGQHYCLYCARYFDSDDVLKIHLKTKAHKKRLKSLRVEPYSQKEAERAAGMGSFLGIKNAEIFTEPTKLDTNTTKKSEEPIDDV
ncbi:hypothetical protein HELRODRAFT_70596 [Helobdella robusta]|uniref:C2H2-type domain-containing protein n=1 Tax=Helobdella robusta TaxID=6412 RepID=T1G091_HELRO|nr:hypothetical protein HELRODRAFT_70596 [Helobdella robusta]ESN90473.1 hypothetical protein HELRODRAFT_70596 [Helobdella robusta]